MFNLQNKIMNRKKIALHNRNNSFDEKESSDPGGYQLNEIMQVINNIYNTNTNLMFRPDSQGLMDELNKEEVQS